MVGETVRRRPGWLTSSWNRAIPVESLVLVLVLVLVESGELVELLESAES